MTTFTSREVVTKTFDIRGNDATEDLQNCLAQLSSLPPDLTAIRFELKVDSVQITSAILAMLVQILNHSLPKASNNTASDSKWDNVQFCSTGFSGEMKYREWQDGRHLLGATLARRTSSLLLDGYREILQCLVSAPKLEFERFSSTQQWRFSTLDCEGLGSIVQRCDRLKVLSLTLPEMEQTQLLVESIGDAIHLQELELLVCHTSANQAVIDIVLRLLQNSQSRLKRLYISSSGFDDRCFTAIVDKLPTSRLKVLTVKGKIEAPGILAFARQLPRIKFLNVVDLRHNPWIHSTRPGPYNECIDALVQGLQANESIQQFVTLRRESEVLYCTTVNWFRRRICTATNPIPEGLWPLIFARVGHRTFHPKMYMATSLYCVLQSGPFLCSAPYFSYREVQGKDDESTVVSTRRAEKNPGCFYRLLQAMRLVKRSI